MIGIIGALAPEVDKINDLLSEKTSVTVSGQEFTLGILGKNRVVTAICGMGKVFSAVCAQIMISSFSPSLVINVGAAGTVSELLHIGDFAVADKLVQHDMDVSPLGYKKGEIAEMSTVYFECSKEAVDGLCKCAEKLSLKAIPCTVATGDVFVCTTEKRLQINSEFGALAAEMEGASIAQVCKMHGVPCTVLRAISDEADGDAPENFPLFLEKVTLDASRLIELFAKEYEI